MIITQSATGHPVVLRFQGMTPDDLDGFEDHRLRIRGDDGNIVRAKSKLNKLLIGRPDWAADLRAEIHEMRLSNFATEMDELKRRKRKKDREQRRVEGPRDPWRKSRHGPMREVILTANAEWFQGFSMIDGKVLGESAKEELFEQLAKGWLLAEFGADVVHARADKDEIAYHVHAVIAPREVTNFRGSVRRMLQPAKFDIIRDYEKAQDSVGAWFAQAGLTRGERRAAATREARKRGDEPPPKPRHTRPHAWRKAEEARLALLAGALEIRRKAVEAREAAAKTREAEIEGKSADADKVTARAVQREAAVAAQEAVVLQREAASSQKMRDAETVILLADHTARGEIEIARTGDGPAQATAVGSAPSAATQRLVKAAQSRGVGGGVVARALDAFARLRARLQTQARDALAAREAELERGLSELRAADDAVVEIANALPAAERSRIAALRSGLVARLTQLKATVRSLRRLNRNDKL